MIRFYIIRRPSDYIIFKVKQEDERIFQEKWKAEIIVEGDSLTELLQNFERDWLFSVDFTRATEE